ncbi:hypothetical protein H0H92_015791 [Tricholoma furcatifolium]|nr:hypothetical protein H0H92_015791 [Tricholoma furcatifolium]
MSLNDDLNGEGFVIIDPAQKVDAKETHLFAKTKPLAALAGDSSLASISSMSSNSSYYTANTSFSPTCSAFATPASSIVLDIDGQVVQNEEHRHRAPVGGSSETETMLDDISKRELQNLLNKMGLGGAGVHFIMSGENIWGHHEEVEEGEATKEEIANKAHKGLVSGEAEENNIRIPTMGEA